MKKVIDVSPKVRAQACKLFGVTERTVFNALNFDPKRGESDKAKRIRQYAKQNGGVEMRVAEDTDTLLYDAEGCFRQYFENGAMLEFDKKTGDGSLYYHGERMLYIHDTMMRELSTLQFIAEEWNDEKTESVREANRQKQKPAAQVPSNVRWVGVTTPLNQ